MRKLLLTSVDNVDIENHRLIDENKIFYVNFDNHVKVDIYNTVKKEIRKIDISKISLFEHRLLFNDKQYFICSMLSH